MIIKESLRELLEREGELSYNECNILWEKEETKVHEDTSDELMEEISDYISTVLNLRESDRVLTIGCGDGHIDRFILPRVSALYGVDFSKQKLDNARKRNPGVEYLKYNFLDAELGSALSDKGINKIYSYSVMQYCRPEDVRRFIEIQMNLLKEDNCLIAHLDVPDIDKAIYYYENRLEGVTAEEIANNKDKIKFLIGDGSCWHNLQEVRNSLEQFKRIKSVNVNKAHYWKFRSDIIIHI